MGTLEISLTQEETMVTTLKMALGSLSFTIFIASASLATAAQPPTPAQTSAEALGGPVTPSSSVLFGEKQSGTHGQVETEALKVNNKTQVNGTPNNLFEWQSELLDGQRRSESGFSFINVNLD